MVSGFPDLGFCRDNVLAAGPGTGGICRASMSFTDTLNQYKNNLLQTSLLVTKKSDAVSLGTCPQDEFFK